MSYNVPTRSAGSVVQHQEKSVKESVKCHGSASTRASRHTTGSSLRADPDLSHPQGPGASHVPRDERKPALPRETHRAALAPERRGTWTHDASSYAGPAAPGPDCPSPTAWDEAEEHLAASLQA